MVIFHINTFMSLSFIQYIFILTEYFKYQVLLFMATGKKTRILKK